MGKCLALPGYSASSCHPGVVILVFGLRHSANDGILEKIVVWSVTVQDIYLGKNLVRLGDFKIRHKAFSQDLVYLTFTLVFHSCQYSKVKRLKLSIALAVSRDAGRGRLKETSLPAF